MVLKNAQKPFRNPTPEMNRISGDVVDAAFKVHFALGPGLLESVYQTCLVHKIRQKNLRVETQVDLPITFEGVSLESGLRLDLLVDKKLVVEIKAVESLLPVHEAQLLTYLKITGCELGLLINFNVPVLKEGIKRIVFSKRNN